MTETPTHPRIGLALGGGGARGIAHVHLLEVMDEMGLAPAAIAGTSIGAILGAGRAAGMSGRDVREALTGAFGNQGEVWARLWQLRPRSIGALAGGFTQFDPERVLELFLPARLPETFADLEIPLTLTATDFYGCAEVGLIEGPLRRAIAASIALPIVFRPVEIDGRVMVDGGVTNPLPYDRMPVPVDLVVAMDVVGQPARPDGRAVPTPIEAVFGASQILMQSITAQKVAIRPPDLLLRPPVDAFRVLDFLKTSAILRATAPVREEIRRGLDALLEDFARGRLARHRGAGDA